ncbi:lipoprotein signal peptidase [Ancylobacter novellus DSM 506]|uniref:Lipoprotein signal peptidase n=1 Tax=Ancylobacter novellus (strain ATCC 8093 / DSM 506 / JCM 20403 / CCM 1077 / IAM 12100 / NBRC 12443 / NCIMB 10456) TaxID=639283 RepID=D6ZZF8_ANCN5|nr:signal peptidase II [Ancylobacter novellus]ADH91153.1 lipoprotein signal peptidase [Ancylobacter novellus DSM 506]
MKLRLAGPLTLYGGAFALAALVVDQASKLAVLHGVDFGPNGIVPVTPFLDIVYAWNTGISYGLFSQGADGWWLLGGLKVIAAVLFWLWLARVDRRLEAAALGLLIGGALGNAIDRAAYGAVFDFVSLHAVGFYWYVFNLSDVAIVAGVGLLLYDSLIGGAAK